MAMETLKDLKDVITVTYAKMVAENPLRSDLVYRVVDLTQKSLLKFNQAYVEFEKIIGADADMYAHWLNLQLQVMTLLDGDGSLLTKLTDTVFETLKGTPAGNTSDVFPDGKKEIPAYPRSFRIALAFRIYLDDIDVIQDPGNPSAPPQPATRG